MALSKCIKCDSRRFEIVENTPSNSNFILMFVQCSSCGGVVGVMDYHNIGQKMNKLEKQIESLSDDLKTSVRKINSNLDIINNNVLNQKQ